MKFKPLMLAAITGLAFSAAQAADIKLVDGIAAVVDSEVITYRDLNQGVATARRNLPKGTQISDEELRRQVLQQLVNQSLVVQAGKRRNLGASDAEIDEALAHTAQARKTTVAALYAQSARDGISRAAVRRNIADSIITQKVQQQAVMQNSRVSEPEIDAFISRAREQGVAVPEGEPVRQYRAQHILIKADSSNAAAAAEAEVRKLYDQARSGVDFAALARQYSQDGSAANGGDLGWFSDGVMVPQFEDAVHQLQPGQVSRPVRSQFGWHIIKLNDVRDSGTPEERQRNAVRQYIAQQKAEQATTGLLQELHQNGYIEIRQP
ncbi:peptidylprolyl isomerase [Uruburuella testudinis]|uniref:Peptidylprolyl isomerase n=1 Tax=Uruburuella testudinis TaxID=1282863 RepID=A0ABY4DTC6_9NEIS|nr:peptidylprolyl isomerase [Uruburuella testudinis]UOO81945.1 peptidylprolyl isomerase [Uruburuella testudinis]